MSRMGTIKAWVAVMLVTAFVAGGTTFLFLGKMFGQIPEAHSPQIPKFREHWIQTFHLTADQVDQMDRVLEEYEKNWDRVLDEMYQKYRPQIAKLQDATGKELDAILTPEQREIQRREVERRRQKTDDGTPESR